MDVATSIVCSFLFTHISVGADMSSFHGSIGMASSSTPPTGPMVLPSLINAPSFLETASVIPSAQRNNMGRIGTTPTCLLNTVTV